MIKKLAVALLIVMIASLSVAGCTSSTPTTTTTSPSTPASADQATKITNMFKAQNSTIIKPFTQSTNQYGNTVYTGTIKDGESVLVPYTQNVTIEQTKDRNTSLSRFNAYVAQAKQQGYTSSLSKTGEYGGYIGQGANPAKYVSVDVVEPQRSFVSIGMGHGAGFDVMQISGSNPTYYVITDYATTA
jgi:hypothetical protein